MGRTITYWVTTGLVAAMSLFAAFSYLTGNSQAVEGFAHVGYPQQLRILRMHRLVTAVVRTGTSPIGCRSRGCGTSSAAWSTARFRDRAVPEARDVSVHARGDGRRGGGAGFAAAIEEEERDMLSNAGSG